MACLLSVLDWSTGRSWADEGCGNRRVDRARKRDELRHAQTLSDRIVQLGGAPILEPKEWYVHTDCGYAVPSDVHVKKILEQNVAGEQCAIDAYNNLLAFTKDKDLITYNMGLEIMTDEVEHEDDLQSLLEDIALIK